MSRFDISLLGDAALSQALARLPEKLERTVLTRALREGTQFLKGLSQPRVPRGKKQKGGGRHLADTLKVKAMKRKKNRVGYLLQTGTRVELGIETAAQRDASKNTQKVYRAVTKGLSKQGLGLTAQGRAHIRGQIRAHFGLPGTGRYYYPAGVELGNIKTPPRAYLRGPLHTSRDAILSVIQRAIAAGIEREMAKQGR